MSLAAGEAIVTAESPGISPGPGGGSAGPARQPDDGIRARARNTGGVTTESGNLAIKTRPSSRNSDGAINHDVVLAVAVLMIQDRIIASSCQAL